jgi:hypothetical protein
MAAGKFIHLLAEPIARDTSLKFDREKAIIFPRKNMNGNVWPALEATGLAENGLGFLPWCFWTGAQHVLRHVVQKICFKIKIRRVAAPRRGLFPRFNRACCAPPCAGCLAGLWDHCVDEHDHPHGRSRANEGCREARQRLSNENDVVSFRNGSDDYVGISCETGMLVIAG